MVTGEWRGSFWNLEIFFNVLQKIQGCPRIFKGAKKKNKPKQNKQIIFMSNHKQVQDLKDLFIYCSFHTGGEQVTRAPSLTPLAGQVDIQHSNTWQPQLVCPFVRFVRSQTKYPDKYQAAEAGLNDVKKTWHCQIAQILFCLLNPLFHWETLMRSSKSTEEICYDWQGQNEDLLSCRCYRQPRSEFLDQKCFCVNGFLDSLNHRCVFRVRNMPQWVHPTFWKALLLITSSCWCSQIFIKMKFTVLLLNFLTQSWILQKSG